MSYFRQKNLCCDTHIACTSNKHFLPPFGKVYTILETRKLEEPAVNVDYSRYYGKIYGGHSKYVKVPTK